jgi:aminoglycoside 6'-N-acetyltransferase Ib
MSNVRPHKQGIVTTSASLVTLRLMTEDDIPRLHAWLRRPHVAEWWAGEESLSLEEARVEYSPRVMASDRETPYIAMLEGQPIGYAQSYVALGCGGGWWEDETDPGVRGIDQFLSEASLLGRGLGTSLVAALVELLFCDPAVTKVQTDPEPTNLRAIRCYEKAGFKAVRTIVTPDGAALYMLRERAQASALPSAA